MKQIIIPEWKEILRSDFAHFWHIDEFIKVVNELGYPYFIWNDRVYKILNEGGNEFTEVCFDGENLFVKPEYL